MSLYSSPLVLGIDQHLPTSSEALDVRLDRYGKNTGNLLFGEALFQTVANARRSSYHFKVAHADAADVIVIAAANWINQYSDFGGLAERLRKTGKPVVIVGIGLQVSDDNPEPMITDGTRALIDLAAETSGMISTRGEMTEQALRQWGYDNVMTTGCPSLLLSDGRFTSHYFHPAPTPENTVLMGTRHGNDPTSSDQNEIYRLAYQTRSDLLLQSELADMYLALNMPRDEHVRAASNYALARSYHDQDIGNIRIYLAKHGKAFFNAREWRDYVQTKEYVIGTRIHGTIAAILSGRRGILLNHDTRTVELAETMGIPTIAINDLMPFSYDKLAAAVDAVDFDLTHRTFPHYFSKFQEFFAANLLPFSRATAGFGGR